MKDSIYREILWGVISVIIGALFAWLSSYLFNSNLSGVFSKISSDEQLMMLSSNELVKLGSKFNNSVSIFIGISTTLILSSFSILYNLRKNQKDIIEEIKNDLLNTHAVIKPHENKLAITAQIMNFHDDTDYKDSIEENAETIDLVRSFTYQDLILTPKYLYYFFNRRNQKGKHSRIIVIKEACQASLTYTVISCLAGYDTFVISDKCYRSFRENHGIIRNSTLNKIFKGNPFIEKKNARITGKYSTFQSQEESPTVNDIDSSMINHTYVCLQCLKLNYCTKIENVETLTNVIDLENILAYNKSKVNCCNYRKKG